MAEVLGDMFASINRWENGRIEDLKEIYRQKS